MRNPTLPPLVLSYLLLFLPKLKLLIAASDAPRPQSSDRLNQSPPAPSRLKQEPIGQRQLPSSSDTAQSLTTRSVRTPRHDPQ